MSSLTSTKDKQGDRITITRRDAGKKSVTALGACYLAPATMNLLLAERATAQSRPEDATFNSSMRICNYLPAVEDEVMVDFVDVFGPGTETIPGGNDPDHGAARAFMDLLDGSARVDTQCTGANIVISNLAVARVKDAAI